MFSGVAMVDETTKAHRISWKAYQMPQEVKRMDLRQIRTLCSRAKLYAQKGETLRAVTALISGLKGTQMLAVATPTDVRTLIRETAQALATDPAVKAVWTSPLRYEAGNEKALLETSVELEKALYSQQTHEPFEQAKARKLKLDQGLNRAMARLEQKQLGEADSLFQEALESYRDEHRVFMYIARAFWDAGSPKRAANYLKKGIAAVPTDMTMRDLMVRIEKELAQEADNG